MKNLKKVFALVVAFSMMLSCAVAFAAYPDVTEDTQYAGAIATLSALGIVGGDDQGNFNPESTITRAEFTKIVCEIQAMSGEGSKGATAFTDVAADHWASGYINFASSMGIVNGMGDGTFVPEGPVTYEQAIKMLVVALGYEPMAKQNGGYPTGYMAVAQQKGVLKGVKAPASSDPAPRNLVAQMTYNALDVPMMVQTGFGNQVTYEVQDGNNNTARTTLLSSKLDVAKLGGVVISNEKLSIDSDLSETKAGDVRFRADENFKNTDSTWDLGSTGIQDFPCAVGETNASDLLGFRCIAYVREVGSSDYEIVAIVEEEGKNNTIVVDQADIDNSDRFVVSTNSGNRKLAYFESDNARRSTQVSLNNDLCIVKNNKAEEDDVLADIKTGADKESARITLVDWDNDDVYDFIKVDAYRHVVVDTVDVERGIIRTKGGDRIDLKIDDKDVNVSIKDKDSNAVELSSIEENDVLAVITDADRVKDFVKNLDIIVLKAADNMITGTITEKDSKASNGKNRVYVDGTEYTLAVQTNDSYISDTDRMDVSSEGTFYLTIDKKIFDYDGSKVTDGEIGVIIGAGDNSTSFNSAADVKLLTKSGLKTYQISNKLRVKAEYTEGVFSVKSFDVEDGQIPVSAFAKTNFATLTKGANNGTITPINLFGKNFDKLPKGATAASLAPILAKRVVKFKVDSDGTITQIAPASNEKMNSSTYPETFDSSLSKDELYGENVTLTKGEYRASTSRLDGNDLNDDAVVFNINKSNPDNSKVMGISSLADEASYEYIMFDSDDDGYNAMLMLSGTAAYSADTGIAVVTKVSTAKDANNDDVTKVTFVQNGESTEKVVTFDEDSVGDTEYGTKDADYLSLRQGDVFLYQADADGLVSDYAVIGQIETTNAGSKLELAAGVVGETFENGRDDVQYRMAYIATSKSGKVELVFDDDGLTPASDTYRISGANEYRYNNVNSNNVRIEVGSFDSGEVDEALTNDAGEILEVSYVMVRIVEKEIKDIYSFNDRFAK